MNTLTFDTLKYAKTLRASGVPEGQAEAIAQAQRDSLQEVLESQLATKADVVNLEKTTRPDIHHLEKTTRSDTHRLETKITLVQWMLGLVIVAEVLPYLKVLPG